jgi:hypothetical protein
MTVDADQENKMKYPKQLLAWYKRRYVLRVAHALVHQASVQVLKQLLDPLSACMIEDCNLFNCVG